MRNEKIWEKAPQAVHTTLLSIDLMNHATNWRDNQWVVVVRLSDIRKSAIASWQGVDQRWGEPLQINTQPGFLSKADATSTQQCNSREKTAKLKQKQKAAKSAAEKRAGLAKLFGISTVNSDTTSAAAAAASTVDMTVNDTTTTAIAASVPSPPRQLLPCHCWWMFLFHLTVPIMRTNCLQLPFRLSQQPTTQRYATISQTILILSSCCRLKSIKQVAREMQSDMHHDECACMHIYASAAKRCAEVICIMMSVCAYLCIGCSEMRRHDIDNASELSRLTDYLSEVGSWHNDVFDG